MKKIIFILSFLVSFVYGQTILKIPGSGFEWTRGYYDSILAIPNGITSLRNVINVPAGTTQVRYNTSDSSIYTWTGSQWLKQGGTFPGIATTSALGLVKIGTGLSIDGFGTLRTAASLLTPGSVPYTGPTGLPIEDPTGLSYDGNNLVVGHSGFGSTTGISINGGRGYLGASGFGLTIQTTGGQPMDASKSISFFNSSTLYAQWALARAFSAVTGTAADSVLTASWNSTLQPYVTNTYDLGIPLKRWRYIRARRIDVDSIFYAGTYLDVAALGSSGGGGTVNVGTENTLAVYSGAGSTVSSLAAIAPNRALTSDVFGLPVASGVTDVELAQLIGIGTSSSVQEQLNNKLNNNFDNIDDVPTALTALGINLSLFEILSNKSTSTSLGTSNTLYPSQGAVKAYVDNNIALLTASRAANLVLAGPASGGSAVPTYRALVAADIPSLSSVYQPLDGDLTAIAANASNGLLKRTGTNTWAVITDNSANWDAAYNDRPVSAAFTGTTTKTLTITQQDGGTVTASFTDDNTGGGAGDVTLTGVQVLTNKDMTSATNTFRQWGSADGGTGNGFTKFTGPATTEKTFTLPNASSTILTTNAAVTATQGGTSFTTYATGDIIYASASNTLSKRAAGTNGYVLTMVSGIPDWQAVAAFPSQTGQANNVLGTNGTTVSWKPVLDSAASLNDSTLRFYKSDGTHKDITFAATGAGSWGTIAGTLSDQTDLQTAFNLKANLASPTFTGTVTLGSATYIASTNYFMGATAVGANQVTAGAGTITSLITYRLVNAGTNFTANVWVGSNATTAASTSLIMDGGNNRLAFVEGNGTGRVARAVITTSVSDNTAASEDNSLIFQTMGGGALADRVTIDNLGQVKLNNYASAAFYQNDTASYKPAVFGSDGKLYQSSWAGGSGGSFASPTFTGTVTMGSSTYVTSTDYFTGATTIGANQLTAGAGVTTSLITYRLVNAGTNITANVWVGSNGTTAATKSIVMDAANDKIIFVEANGTGRIARATLTTSTSDNTAGSEDNSLIFRTIGAGTIADRMTITNTGEIDLANYGTGANTGTAAYTLGVTAAGKLIEIAGGGGGSVSALTDVTLTSLATNDFLKYNGTAWINRTPANVLSDIGAQASDADLTTIAGLTATTDNFIIGVSSAWASRTPAQARTTLALVIGTNVQAWDTDLDTWATKTAPSGTVLGTTDTQTETNKRITKRIGTTTSSATPTINTDNVDVYTITAQSVDITSFTTNLSGTPTDGQQLLISITGTGARNITWGTSFESSSITLPTQTISTNRLDVLFIWNAATSKWRVIGTA